MREILARDGYNDGELLRLAASVDRLSAHVLGEALVTAAARDGLELTLPTDVREQPGQGIEGVIDGHRVAVGSRAFLGRRASQLMRSPPAQ